MRFFRRELSPWFRKKLRADRKKSELEANFIERYLDDQYVNTYDKDRQSINLQIVKSTCTEFNRKNPLCRCCRFYTTRVQEEKFGFACKIWDTAFGKALKQVVIDYTFKQNIRITPKFIDLWNSRKAAVISSVPQQIATQHIPTSAQKQAERLQKQTGVSVVIVGH